MGWSVGFDRDEGRFIGYGVPAYCDASGCGSEIDRGMGYQVEPVAPAELLEDNDALDEWRDNLDPCEIPKWFVCGRHSITDVIAPLPSEHPDWLAHVLSDASWNEWREQNRGLAGVYRTQLERGV